MCSLRNVTKDKTHPQHRTRLHNIQNSMSHSSSCAIAFGTSTQTPPYSQPQNTLVCSTLCLASGAKNQSTKVTPETIYRASRRSEAQPERRRRGSQLGSPRRSSHLVRMDSNTSPAHRSAPLRFPFQFSFPHYFMLQNKARRPRGQVNIWCYQAHQLILALPLIYI